MPCPNHPDAADRLGTCARCGGSFCPSCLVALQGAWFCAACKVERLRDVRSGVAAPALGLPLAGPGRRFLAFFLDSLLLGVPVGILFVLVFAATIGFGAGSDFDPETMDRIFMPAFMLVVYVVGPLLSVSYEALMLRRWGQTIGKMALGIKVVSAGGGPLTTGQAWMRPFIRVLLSFLSCIGLLVDYVPAFTTPEQTCVHDMAAKTRVVMA